MAIRFNKSSPELWNEDLAPTDPSHRTWTVSFLGVDQAPKQVHAGAAKLTASAWHYDATTHALRITLPAHSIHSALTIAYQ